MEHSTIGEIKNKPVTATLQDQYRSLQRQLKSLSAFIFSKDKRDALSHKEETKVLAELYQIKSKMEEIENTPYREVTKPKIIQVKKYNSRLNYEI